MLEQGIFGFTFTVSDGKHELPPVNFTFDVNAGEDGEAPQFINMYPVLQVSRDGTAFIGLWTVCYSIHFTTSMFGEPYG